MIDWDVIKNTGKNRLLFVGMGNRIKQDDGAGIYIAEQLMANGIKNVIIAENSIENYIGKINRQKANTIILIDAVDFGKEPGFYKLLPIDEITNTTSNTHNLSLRTISSFLETPDKRVLGIQPGKVSFGTELSEKIAAVSNQLVMEISSNMEKICFEPIGVVESQFENPEDLIFACKKGLDTKTISTITLNEKLEEGLCGLNEFSHVFVIYFLDQATNIELLTHPGPPTETELPKVGVFASRSQYRPNHFALRLVKLLAIEGNKLRVEGLDAINGSKVLDIKPYVHRFDRPKQFKTASWYNWLDS